MLNAIVSFKKNVINCTQHSKNASTELTSQTRFTI